MDLEEFPRSESAARMLSYLSAGFYGKSYVGKWIFEVMGREWDDIKELFNTFPIQAFPSTATWALPYYEQKYGLESNGIFEKRLQRLLEKITITLPFNPYKIIQSASSLTGVNQEYIVVEEYPRQYSFRVSFLLQESLDAKMSQIKSYLLNVKPAHLLLLLDKVLKTDFFVGMLLSSVLKVNSGFQPDANLELNRLMISGDSKAALNCNNDLILQSGTEGISGIMHTGMQLHSVLLTDVSGTSAILAIKESIGVVTGVTRRLRMWQGVQVSNKVDTGFWTDTRICANTMVESEVGINSGYLAETAAESWLRVENDLWHLDGGLCLDGSRRLDASVENYHL